MIGFDNPWWNLGVGILSHPTLGQGLFAGTQQAQQAQQNALANQALQQKLQENARRVAIAQQVGSLMNGNNRPPSLLQRPDLEQFIGNQLSGLLGEYDPTSVTGLLSKSGGMAFDKIDPSKFTPRSLQKFAVSGNWSDLVPVESDQTTGDVRQYVDAKKLGLIPPNMAFNDYLTQVKRPLVQTFNIPSGYTMDPNNAGGLMPIPGGPADPAAKPLTEDQAKAGGYADRAITSSGIINSLTGRYSPAAINAKTAADNAWLIGGTITGPIANSMLSPEDQQAEQAQRDFVNAILRRESGAVISQQEFDNARKQYFPQAGDSPQVIQQKAKNRQTAIDGLTRSAGPKYSPPKNQTPSIPNEVDPAVWEYMTPEERSLWQR